MQNLKKFSRFFRGVFFVCLIFGLSVFCLTKNASAKAYYYETETIEVDIVINQDSTFDVLEKQTYRLDGSYGFFYRDIELKDLDHLSNIEVFDSEGNKLTEDRYTVSNEGNRKKIRWDFARRDFDNELKSWSVKYKVHGGLKLKNQNFDELYWNAIFSDREVNVITAKVVITLPDQFEKDQIGHWLYLGSVGSKQQSDNHRVVDKQRVEYWGLKIEPGHYLTISVTWPKGFVEKPFLYRSQIINLGALIISLVLLFLFIGQAYRIWAKKGRDPKLRKTIIAQYKPPANLSPAMIGLLIKQRIDIKDISATLVDLAVRGYVKIGEGKKGIFTGQEYIFEKLKSEEGLSFYEQKIMRGIFTKVNQMKSRELIKELAKIIRQSKDIRKLKKEAREEAMQTRIDKWQDKIDQPITMVSSNDLKNKFYMRISAIKKAIHLEMNKTNYFTGHIDKIRNKYTFRHILIMFGGLIVFFTGFAMTAIFGSWGVGIILIGGSLFISGIVGMFFAYYMPALTPQGLEIKWQALGFKEYLHTAERFRIGAETVKTFSKFLPYAMIFGVEKQWAQRFAGLSFKDENWYIPAAMARGQSGSGSIGSISNFSSNFSAFSSSISSALGSSPRGGSGAGGGGGGGGAGGGGGGAG